MFSFRSMLVLCALALTVGFRASTAQADQVDSPLYKAWASFKVGSNKTLSTTISFNGVEVKSEQTATLMEVTDDHVTVQTVTSHTVNGQSRASTPHTQTFPAKMDNNGVKLGDDESVDATGKTFKCKTYTLSSDAIGGMSNAKGELKIWASDQVPGGVVKMEATSQRPGATAPATVTYILTNYEAK